MLTKFFRVLGSSIEEEIINSFGDMVIGKYILVEKDLGDNLLADWQNIVKRGMDILVSGIFVWICLPLFGIIALAIKITSKGPVFFKQERVGQAGKKFYIWKFRTMHHENSQEEHRQYIQHLLKEGHDAENRVDLLTKYIDYVDRKTTKMGRFLRVTSLDELPQLFNILLGDMSLVGPRPHPVYEVNEYKEWYRRRLNVKPGITGWSKLNLRLTPKDYEEAILYDLWYVDHRSLTLDLRITVMTIPFVLFKKDAH